MSNQSQEQATLPEETTTPSSPLSSMSDSDTIGAEPEWDITTIEHGDAPGLIGYVYHADFKGVPYNLPKHMRCQGEYTISLLGPWTVLRLDDGMVYIISKNTCKILIGSYEMADLDSRQQVGFWTLPQMLSIFQPGPGKISTEFEKTELSLARRLIECVASYEMTKIHRYRFVEHVLHKERDRDRIRKLEIAQTPEAKYYALFLGIYAMQDHELIYFYASNPSRPKLTSQLPATIMHLKALDRNTIQMSIEFVLDGELETSEFWIDTQQTDSIEDYGIFHKTEVKIPPEMLEWLRMRH